MLSIAEQLTEQFYLWEQRGRGWQVWDYPVELEPPFEHFHFRLHTWQPVDDGRKHTILSQMVETLTRARTGWIHAKADVDSHEPPSPITPTLFEDDSPLCEIGIAMPPDEGVTGEQAEQFLLSLALCHDPVSFEVVGMSERVTVQIACREADLAVVEGALKSYFPSAVLQRQSTSVLGCLPPEQTLVVEFGLSEEFMRPLKPALSFDPDPLVGFVGGMEGIQDGETGLVQILFQGTRFPWTESIMRAVSDGQGGSFFADAPDMVHLAHGKTRWPLFTAVVRVVGSSRSSERSWSIVRGLAGGLVQFCDPQSNEFIPLTNDGYDHLDHVEDVARRRSHRSGLILNCRELASLVHPPSSSVRSSKVLRHFAKTRPAPQVVRGHGYMLGSNSHRGLTTQVSLSLRQRLNHIHIIGATGTGKSTLLHSLIVQDIEWGLGLAVIDPHGDLIDKVLGYIPRKRLKDVVLFDPSDSENPRGINILAAEGEAEKNVAASDLVAVFKRMSTSWGDQMTVVLGNAIQAFLESDGGGSLIELRRFLLDNEFRTEFLKSVRDQEVRCFWEQEHQLLRGNTIGSLLTRLDTFLRPKVVRRVIAPTVDLKVNEIMNQQRILLVKLAQGLIGEENSTLLGTLVVSKLHQAALARQALAADKRDPFFLYIDEFQNFITPSLAGVLSGTRKYGLGLVLAHQEMRQIFNQDTGVANSVMSNPGTRVCFRLGDFDAQKLQEGFAHFTAQDMQNLGLGEAVCRVERSDDDFNLKVAPQRPINAETSKARRKRLIELSHAMVQSPETPEPEVDDQEPRLADVVVTRPSPPKLPFELPPTVQRENPVLASLPAELSQPGEDEGISQHRYLQTLIRRMAEDRGYRAVVEEPTPDGSGRVDVGLERDGERIACEIAVTTTDDHEVRNIRKCLAAGYDKVIVCAADRRRLEQLRKSVEMAKAERVFFFEPPELFAFLEHATAQTPSTEQRIKGYRVKVEYQAVQESERQSKRDAVADVILKSMRRMKGK